MLPRDPLSADRRRKEREGRMIMEGTALYKQKKHRDALEKRDEQRKLQAMLANYHPWGRPGGGAPNPEVRRRPLTLTQVDYKKGLDQTLPRVGPKPPILRKSDPILRYQLNDQVRKSIENHVRYRRPYQEQQQYKQQLDRLVADKRRLQSEERRDDRHLWGMTCSTPTPWGRPGPGGSQWRDPRAIGQNFLHSLGWTGEPVFQRLEYEHELLDGRRAQTPRYPMLTEAPHREMTHRTEFHPPEEMMTGGVELVPLLARRRVGYRKKELGSTDVTRRANCGPPPKPVWKPIANEGDYLKELTCQILNKEAKVKEARTENIVESRRHFETWGGFWGRPGHGAPKGTTHKENLDNLLYRMPIAAM